MDKKSNSKYQLALPVTFILLLFLPMLNNKLEFWKFERSDENRTFTDSLEVDFSHLDEFPEDCEAYVNDNFSFRAPLLDLYHSMKFNVFQTSPHPDKTILGRHDWYFTSGKHKECYTGERDFTSDTLQLLLKEWKRRTDYLSKRNIKTYWIIAPIKHNVYSEELPFNILGAQKSRVDQLKDYFQSSLPNLIIDPTPSLLRAKKDNKLYYKLDNHWNYRAGSVTTDLLLSHIKVDFPNRIDEINPVYTWGDSIEKSGIHYVVLGMKHLGERREFPICAKSRSVEDAKYDFTCPPGFAAPWDFEHRYTINDDTTGLKILFIRDSFGHQMMPFVREYFKESVFIFDAWQYKLNEDIIEKINPDIVVFLTLESLLEGLISH